MKETGKTRVYWCAEYQEIDGETEQINDRVHLCKTCLEKRQKEEDENYQGRLTVEYDNDYGRCDECGAY